MLLLNFFQHKASEPFPGCITPGMKYPATAVTTFQPEEKFSVFLIEQHAQFNYFLNAFLSFGDQNFNRIAVAKASSGNQSVLNM